MSSQICTEPSVTTPIQKPQIYILKQQKASQCYFVIYKQHYLVFYKILLYHKCTQSGTHTLKLIENKI